MNDESSEKPICNSIRRPGFQLENVENLNNQKRKVSFTRLIPMFTVKDQRKTGLFVVVIVKNEFMDVSGTEPVGLGNCDLVNF
jgi:hypothetical protein